MRFIPKYRVGYNGQFYETAQEFQINPKDADEMRKHGKVLDDPTPPSNGLKRAGRPPRRIEENGQSGKAETANRRT